MEDFGPLFLYCRIILCIRKGVKNVIFAVSLYLAVNVGLITIAAILHGKCRML